MSESIEDEGVPLDPAFHEYVLPAELEALKSRSSSSSRAAGRTDGLPDFRAQLTETADFSPFFRHALDRLEDPDQSQRWQDWANGDTQARHAGLTGLAMSGGGIRSSTLNLGMVQVIQRIGLFKCLDYLSTVSGGGYLGSSISSFFAADAPEGGDRLSTADEGFPYQHVPGKPESLAFLQLRNYSRFLVPRGFIDYLRLPVLLIRGILLNFLVVLPWILGLVLLTHTMLVQPADGSGLIWRWDLLEWWPGHRLPFGSTLLLTCVLALLALLFPIARMAQIIDEGIESTRRFRWYYEGTMVFVMVAIPVTAWVELQPLALQFLLDADWKAPLTATAGAGSALLAALGHKFAGKLESLARRYALYLVALAGFVAFWLLYLLLVTWLVDQPPWWPDDDAFLPLSYAYVVVLAVFGVYSATVIDANGLSLHNFYRDQLAKAFLFEIRDGRVRSRLDVKLSQLSPHLGPVHVINTALNTRKFPERFRKGRKSDLFFFSPLYSGSRTTGYCPTSKLEEKQKDLSVSTAVATSGAAVSSNMGSKGNAALRVILSMLNIRLGYWLINPYFYDPETERFRFHPGQLLKVGVVRYLQELTGWLDYKKSYVYLSDGGHIENMGIYPLVQRQCRLIILGDGECDPGYTFQGLLDAIRMIRVDFGIEIEMDGLDEIRSGVQQHALGTIHYPDGRLGYLIYLKSSLLGDDMIKATVSEQAYVTSPLRSDVRHYDELGYIAHYKALHPDFPHETTADQFFDEGQFECYRALGYVIADRAFTGRR